MVNKSSFQSLGRACIPQRYVLGIMGLLGIANAYIMRACLSLAITAMVRYTETDDTYINEEECPFEQGSTQSNTTSNSTTTSAVGTYDWDEETQGMILSAFYYGYIITHVPGGMLAEKFGGKHTLGLGIFSTALFTLLTPVVADNLGAWGMIVLRFFTGMGEGTTFPALTTLLAAWAPPLEKSRLSSMAFAGVQLGTIIANLVGGIIVQFWGWPSVFYVFGILGIVWFIIWCLICFSDPQSHPFITEEERTYLAKTIGSTQRNKDLAVTPWFKLLTSWPVWALIIAETGHDWGLFTMVTDLPKYMSDVMHFDIAQNGVVSAMPFLVMWLMSLGLGGLADWILIKGYLTTSGLRKWFATIGQLGPGIGVILASYAGCDRVMVTVLFTIGMGLMGFSYPSIRVNSLDLSPNYAGSIMALQNGISSISGMVTPYLIGILTPNRSLREWRVVFFVMFGVLFVANCIFVWFGSGEVQPWNDFKKQKPSTTHPDENGKHSDSTDQRKRSKSTIP